MICPQCKLLIDDIRTDEYHVGWCKMDVHTQCVPLHVRSCQPCYQYNTGFILQHDQDNAHAQQRAKGKP